MRERYSTRDRRHRSPRGGVAELAVRRGCRPRPRAPCCGPA